jgi:Cu+-exporting ATPase
MTDRQPTTVAKDPVCGMDVDPAATKHRSEYGGRTYFFCSLMCKKAFEDDPRHYLGQGQRLDLTRSAGR